MKVVETGSTIDFFYGSAAYFENEFSSLGRWRK
jgi:hypothetical protein